MKKLNKIILSSGLLVLIIVIPIIVLHFRPIETIYPTHDKYIFYYWDGEIIKEDEFYLMCSYYVSAEGEENISSHRISFLEFIVPENIRRAELKIWIRDFTLSYVPNTGLTERFEMTCMVKCNGRIVDYIYVNQWEHLVGLVDYKNISLSIPMEIHSINNTITIEPVIRTPQYYNITTHSEASVYFYSSNLTIWGGELNPFRPRLECYVI